MILSLFILTLLCLLAASLLVRGLILLFLAARSGIPARRQTALTGLFWLAAGCGFFASGAFLFSAAQRRARDDSVPFEQCAVFGIFYLAAVLTLWALRRFTFRGNRALVKVVAGFLLLYASVLAQRIYVGGPIAAVPNCVLLAGMTAFPDSMIIKDTNPAHEDWSLRARTSVGRLFPWERMWALARAQPIAVFGAKRESARMQWFVNKLGPEVVTAFELKSLRGIASSDPQVREITAYADTTKVPWCPSPPLGEAVRPFESALVSALSDPVKEVRGLAAWYLTELGNDADKYVPLMLKNLAIPTPATLNLHSVGNLTPDAIARRAAASESSMRLLLAATRSPDNELAWRATRLLKHPGIFYRGGCDRLLELVNDPEVERASTAAIELSRSPLDKSQSLPILVDFILAHHPSGPRTSDLYVYDDELVIRYLPHLIPLLDSDDVEERSAVVHLLWNLYPSNSIDETLILPSLRTIAAFGDPDEAKEAVLLIDRIVERTAPESP